MAAQQQLHKDRLQNWLPLIPTCSQVHVSNSQRNWQRLDPFNWSGSLCCDWLLCLDVHAASLARSEVGLLSCPSKWVHCWLVCSVWQYWSYSSWAHIFPQLLQSSRRNFWNGRRDNKTWNFTSHKSNTKLCNMRSEVSSQRSWLHRRTSQINECQV